MQSLEHLSTSRMSGTTGSISTMSTDKRRSLDQNLSGGSLLTNMSKQSRRETTPEVPLSKAPQGPGLVVPELCSGQLAEHLKEMALATELMPDADSVLGSEPLPSLN